MKFRFGHNNSNLKDPAKSLQFYCDALGLVETRRKEMEDFTPVFLGDGEYEENIIFILCPKQMDAEKAG